MVGRGAVGVTRDGRHPGMAAARLPVPARRVRRPMQLDDDGLTVVLTGHNAGDVDLPYGVGQHPYVTAGTELVDDAVLTVPAAAWLPHRRPWTARVDRAGGRDTVGLPIWSAGRRHGAGHSVRRTRPRREGPRRRTPGAGRRDARRRGLGRRRARTTSRCSPGTRWHRGGGAAVWRSSRCPAPPTHSTAGPVWSGSSRGRSTPFSGVCTLGEIPPTGGLGARGQATRR